MRRVRTLLPVLLVTALLAPAGAHGQDGATGATGPAPAATTPAPAPEAAPDPSAADGSVAGAADRTSSSDAVPLPLLLLGVVAALALLAGLVWALARRLALDPPWLARGRHAMGEAGWRLSASWAEFTDWVRLGR